MIRNGVEIREAHERVASPKRRAVVWQRLHDQIGQGNLRAASITAQHLEAAYMGIGLVRCPICREPRALMPCADDPAYGSCVDCETSFPLSEVVR